MNCIIILTIVYLQEKDKYGNEVTRLARPLPVEYLLTDMSVGFPMEQTYTLAALSVNKDRFPASNRSDIGGYMLMLSSTLT